MPVLLTPSALLPSPATMVPFVADPLLTPPLLPSPKLSGIATTAAEPPSSGIPLVTLDSENISDTMAARLTASLIQHVLFLKNQVPFPIVQLARLPSGINSRATKKKEELLDAVDTLTCHLLTTFTALAAALAQNTSRYPQGEGNPKPNARADVVVVLGPSIAGARARVFLTIDGLEVKIWGHRDYDQEEAQTDEDSSESEDSEDEGVEEEEEDETDTESDDAVHSEDDSARPPSPPVSETSSKDEESRELLQPPESPQPQRRRQPFSPRPSGITQTEEAQVLGAAERLLSRTLANACAEEGNGLGSEMAPTLTHVLVRAPRRFSHPSWVPRQNLTAGLDVVYNDFLEHSGNSSKSINGKKPRPKRSGIKTEGVRVVCRRVSVEDDWNHLSETVHEDDEMIWWSWNGRLVGFADW